MLSCTRRAGTPSAGGGGKRRCAAPRTTRARQAAIPSRTASATNVTESTVVITRPETREEKVRPELRAGDNSHRERKRPAQSGPDVVAAVDEMGQGGGAAHEDQHEMRGCRGYVHGEAERPDEQRDVDHASTDAEEARDETDDDAQRDAASDRDLEANTTPAESVRTRGEPARRSTWPLLRLVRSQSPRLSSTAAMIRSKIERRTAPTAIAPSTAPGSVARAKRLPSDSRFALGASRQANPRGR